MLIDRYRVIRCDADLGSLLGIEDIAAPVSYEAEDFKM